MLTQSCDSVPPAPGCIVNIAFLWSSFSLKSFRIWTFSIKFPNLKFRTNVILSGPDAENYIHGKRACNSTEHIGVFDPSTGEEISKVVLSNADDFNSTIVELTIVVFMLLGATNFTLHYLFIVMQNSFIVN